MAALAVLVGCGGGTSEADQAYIDAITASAADEFPASVDPGCVAEGLVGALGGASGIEGTYGLTPADFADDIDVDMQEADARAASTALWECDGVPESFFSDVAGTDDADTISCLDDNLTHDNIKTLIAAGFMGDAGAALEAGIENEFEREIIAAAATCNLG